MMPSNPLIKELNLLIDKEVTVELRDGSKLRGVLKAVDPSNLNLVLSDIMIGKDLYSKIVFSGENIRAIYLKAIKFDMSELRRRLERVFPKMVHYKVDERAIIVMDKFRVTEDGVEGEPGPILERVRRVYDDYMRELKGQV
ncbi:TPA: hypothetical protein EYP83_01660 [Candidatus Geothermarchaeota archaeon]|nr:hypothetical protein [Candidatus Geothermarchaeota archaeon]